MNKAPDPNETVGVRPYEMTEANRKEPFPPTLRFDDLSGWKMEVSGGAEAVLQVSRAQNVWDRPVARLRYRGKGETGASPAISIVPPNPAPLPDGADCVEMWVYGNRWDWENPPDTPPLRIDLRLLDANGDLSTLTVDRVRWQEWWLLHRKLPAGLKFPVSLVGIDFAGGTQADWRDIFLDSIRFYKEEIAPLKFQSRPRRNLTLFPGQSPGANTGKSRFPFPTREETILPEVKGEAGESVVAKSAEGYVFDHRGKDGTLRYRFDPAKGLSGVVAEYDGSPVGALLSGGGVKRDGDAGDTRLLRSSLRDGVVSAVYDDGTTLRLRILRKSLVVDVANETGRATELSFGRLTGLSEPRTIAIPYLSFGGNRPSVLLAKAGGKRVFASIWLDPYRSNGSEPYGAEESDRDSARINGGVRYVPKTDGKRNPLFERIFVTVSPTFEETLPVIPNPVGLHSKEAADRLWQESWGPDDYAKQMKRSEMLRAYGISKLIQCNHEIAWRDGGESFTLRLHAAPKKGGDEALQRYVAHQKGLGWLSGLYSNYTDYAPVNRHWTPDAVQRESSGEWRSAWPRCWALKPLAAVQFDAELAPQIHEKYGSDAAYTDVQTAVAPWGYNDFDARAPGAGTFAQTLYAYGELLRNDSRAYGGPIFSEGTYQWLYAGLADGNYGVCYGAPPLATEPLLPVFDLLQIHPKECDIGMGWTSYFCDAIPNWRDKANLDRSIDRFLLHILAYGHIGWLVEEEFGIDRTCRSYYMLQAVQARYGLKTPNRIAYWDGKRLRSVSEAIALDLPKSRRQLVVEYPGGLTLWLNDHPTESWRVRLGKREIVLPPAGWAAYQAGGKEGAPSLMSYSAEDGSGGKVDYLRCESYVYLDGRGKPFDAPEAASNGGLAISPEGKDRLRAIRISGDGEFVVRRPFGVKGRLTGCEAFDVEGRSLGHPTAKDDGMETRIEPTKDAVRYEFAFDGKRAKGGDRL